MKKLQKILKIFVIFSILALYIMNIVYSTSETFIPVTFENLKAAYNSFLAVTDSPNFYAETTKESINIFSDGETNTLKYVIADDGSVTFSIDSVIASSMDYDSYSKEISKTIYPIYGFLGVTTVQEVELLDAFTYISNDLLASDISDIPNFSSSLFSFSSESYIKNSSGEIINVDSNKAFSPLEEIQKYDAGIVCSDSDEFGLYTWEVKKTSSDATNTTITSTLKVNNSNNYIKLDKYNENHKDSLNVTDNSISFNRIETQNIVINTGTNAATNTATNVPKQNVVINEEIKELPKAGINITLINAIKVILVISVIALVLYTAYNISHRSDK